MASAKKLCSSPHFFPSRAAASSDRHGRAEPRGRSILCCKMAAMTVDEFLASVKSDAPPEMVSPSLVALWYDAKGDWDRAHGMVDSLESNEGMAVHAYL